ncbi:MAG: hypothetical protein CR968_00445 [Flavobacteriia bacterium]|nr:MAG: hypothetical protein CR968_00445 [Flavobacteriia bacterium]
MQKTALHTQRIKLNGERVTRHYTSEISTVIVQDGKQVFNAIANEFDLMYLGQDPEGLLNYKIQNKRRLLLNKKFSVIRKLNKAQNIALEAAKVNDLLECKVTKNFKLVKVVNTNAIREQWQHIKASLLTQYPDLEAMANDFDWQLQDEHIQRVYLEDNFYNFFFSNIFFREFIAKQPVEEHKVISNAVGNISIPVVEYKRISKQDRAFTEVEVQAHAEIDTEHENFPLAKLNAFLGKLPTTTGSKHHLEFIYNGTYNITPTNGLVTQGKLEYTFAIGALYSKTTRITFNLEDDE